MSTGFVGNPPPLWMDVMEEHEIYGSLGCGIHRRTNLLVSSGVNSGGLKWDITLNIPWGMSVQKTIHDSLQMDAPMKLDDFKLFWDIRERQISTKFFWLLDVEDCMLPDVVDFRFDEQSLHCPFPDMNFQQCRILEFFSGGYGGWHIASKILSEFTQQQFRTVGIDSELAACRNYCLSNEVPLISGQSSIPCGFFEQLDSDCVIHSDVNSRNWLPAVVHWRPQIACVSAPCQPWSYAGLKQGLSSHNGVHLAEAISVCRFIQPLFLLVEQVAGFLSHSHKQWVLRTCTAAGFTLMWAKVIDLSTVCPTQRPRWIALFRHASVTEGDSKHIQHLPNYPMTSPVSFDAVLSPEQTKDPRVNLSPQAFRVLSEFGFLPAAKKQTLMKPITPQKVLLSRCTSVFAITPTFLANYGSQHLLDHDQLRDKGCLTHLVREPSGRFRHWHPAEVFMLHLGFSQFFVEADWKHAYKFLGNQISSVHALFAIVNAFNFLSFQASQVSLHQVIEFATKHRVTASNCRFHSSPYGVMVSKKECVPMAVRFESLPAVKQLYDLGESQLPADSCWTFTGFKLIGDYGPLTSAISSVTSLAVSDASEEASTMPFVPKVPLRLHCQTPTTFWSAVDTKCDFLSSLWDFSFSLRINDLGHFDLIPTDENSVDSHHPVAQDLVICHIDSRYTIVPAQHDNFDEQCHEFFGNEPVFDQFGKIGLGVKPIAATLLTQQELLHQTSTIENVMLLAAFQQATVVSGYQPFTDTIVYSFDGHPDAVKLLASFFSGAIRPASLKHLGRACAQFQNKVEFGPSHASDPVPPAVFRTILVICLTRSLADSMQCSQGVPIKVKWLGRVLFSGKFHQKETTDSFKAFLSAIFSLLIPDENVNLVHKGVRLTNSTLEEIVAPSSVGPAVFHLVRSMHGGGNKQQQRVQVKNSIAGTLIEMGIDLQWILTHLEKILDASGFQKLSPIAALPPGQNRNKQIVDLFSDAGFPVPVQPKKATLPASLQNKMRKKAPSAPIPSNIKVESGF